MCFCALPPIPIDIILFFGKCLSLITVLPNTQATQNHMPPSEFIVLICGDDCSASRSDGSEPGLSILCDAPHPKCKAIVGDWSVPAASVAVASLVPAKFAPKCGLVGATPPSSLVLDIIGIAAGGRGCRCEDNMVCCGDLLKEDSVVHLCMERILVPNFLAGKGRKKREVTAITVNWVTDGLDCCRVRFLPWAYALEGAIYHGFLCRVSEVFSKSDPSCVIHEKWYKNKVFARAKVISALNECVPPIGSVETSAVAGMKCDYLP